MKISGTFKQTDLQPELYAALAKAQAGNRLSRFLRDLAIRGLNTPRTPDHKTYAGEGVVEFHTRVPRDSHLAKAILQCKAEQLIPGNQAFMDFVCAGWQTAPQAATAPLEAQDKPQASTVQASQVVEMVGMAQVVDQVTSTTAAVAPEYANRPSTQEAKPADQPEPRGAKAQGAATPAPTPVIAKVEPIQIATARAVNDGMGDISPKPTTSCPTCSANSTLRTPAATWPWPLERELTPIS